MNSALRADRPEMCQNVREHSIQKRKSPRATHLVIAVPPALFVTTRSVLPLPAIPTTHTLMSSTPEDVIMDDDDSDDGKTSSRPVHIYDDDEYMFGRMEMAS